jgi:ssDNA-binding Zn-finger/Zn-ribbon topoisomerase 1
VGYKNMPSTIESIEGAVHRRLAILGKVLDGRRNFAEVFSLVEILKKAEERFELGEVGMWAERTRDNSLRELQKFTDFIVRSKVLNDLDFVFGRVRELRWISRKMEAEYCAGEVEFPKEDLTKKCECGALLATDCLSSEMICVNCGLTQQAEGVMLDDGAENWSKQGKYDPMKHCRSWLDKIQARGVPNFPQELVDSVKQKIEASKLKATNVSCDQVRKYLSEMRKSKYNDRVPMIHKLATGVGPPQLSEDESRLVLSYCVRVIDIYNSIKPDGKQNCPYCPYFIRKILEQLMRERSQRKRRDAIISRIHMQSRDTIIKNDNIWKQICKQIPEFKYKPTI